MAGIVQEIRGVLGAGIEPMAAEIVNMYQSFSTQRQKWMEEKKELNEYIFATDTRKTANSKLPWKNSTTLPKLCQIRDNLHANYMSALYPNDDFLMWIAQDNEGLDSEKAKAITTYVLNKLQQQNFRETLSRLVYDYIDTGNVAAHIEYIHKSTTDELENPIDVYIGPRVVRDSMYDIVFNPLARAFEDSPKITRELVSLGELKSRIEEEPENSGWLKDAFDKVKHRRLGVAAYRPSDVNKAAALAMAGFGSYSEYLASGYVEIFNFEGTLYDAHNDVLYKNYVITVVDRDFVIRKIQNPSWVGTSSIKHTGWRLRPDNLYAMGPLDNIVGMQYRIDHLENAKADFWDLAAHPPLVIKGHVEPFDWQPFEQIQAGDDGAVDILKVDSAAFTADTQIAILMQYMEEMAGAPKQSIGARTPGEKTAFEVQTLEQNASKLFQEKIINFEVNFLEPLMIAFLESARRNLNGSDLIAVMDDDLGVKSFMSITAEDLKSRGRLRPMAARNFAARAQVIQNLQGAMSIAQDQGVRRHWSGKRIAQLLETGLRLDKHSLFQANVQISEDLEAQTLMNAGQQVVAEEQATDTTPEIPQL